MPDSERTLVVSESGVETREASAPSLRQYELDQVHRVTALLAPAVSQPLVGTPLVKRQGWEKVVVLSTAILAGPYIVSDSEYNQYGSSF